MRLSVRIFEWEDFNWFPTFLRDAATVYLSFIISKTGFASFLSAVLLDVMKQARQYKIIDLCSGAGGPLPSILKNFEEKKLKVAATLTDRFPNYESQNYLKLITESWKSVCVYYHPCSLDAMHVPKSLSGIRTLFNSFHHFERKAAKDLLQNNVNANAPIFIIECAGRAPGHFIGVLLLVIASFFVVPFLKPMRFSWLILTYLIPILPLLILWDGWASCLRAYTIQELQLMTQGVTNQKNYHWQIGQLSHFKNIFPATYVIGIPQLD